MPPRQNEFGRTTLAHHPRKEQTRSRFRHETKLDKRCGKLCRGLDIDQIAMQEKGQPDANGDAIDRSDHRHPHRRKSGEETRNLIERCTGSELSQVVSGGEDIAQHR